MILREAVEKRRAELINKLITFGAFKIKEKHLFQVTLSELESEYKRFLVGMHPHGQLGSIRWSKKKIDCI